MIGAKHFEIGYEEFISGLTTGPNTYDGGYSTETTAINPLASHGVLLPPGAVTDKSTNVVGQIIASCNDPLILGADRVFLDDEGNFYTWNGTTMTLARTDAAHAYVPGKTDMSAYQTAVFATSATHVTAWTVDSTFNATFYAFTGASGGTDALVPHPTLTYEDNIYYGNKQLLLRQTSVGGAPAVILTLPADQTIVTLGIDPGSGRMLISTTTALNLSDRTNAINRVQYYDGFSNKTLKTVIVDDMVTAFAPSSGDVYVTYGQSFGVWTGSGIRFIRNLPVGYLFNDLAYKQHITNIEDTLYIIENTKVLAYGHIVPGKGKVFYYAIKNNEGLSGNYNHIANIGQGKLGLSFATDKFFTFDVNTVSAIISGGAQFVSKKYKFPRNVTFNGAIIELDRDAPINDNIGTLLLVDSNGNQTTLLTINTTNADQREFEAPYPTIQTRSMQFKYTLSAGTAANVAGVIRITVFYTPKEQ